MPELTPADAATVLRQTVSLLSERMPVDPASLVPGASTEHLAALAVALERLGSDGANAERRLAAAGIGAEHVSALDTWIRVADGFMLHYDARETHERASLGEGLRAVRTLVTPATRQLRPDPRDTEEAPER